MLLKHLPVLASALLPLLTAVSATPIANHASLAALAKRSSTLEPLETYNSPKDQQDNYDHPPTSPHQPMHHKQLSGDKDAVYALAHAYILKLNIDLAKIAFWKSVEGAQEGWQSFQQSQQGWHSPDDCAEKWEAEQAHNVVTKEIRMAFWDAVADLVKADVATGLYIQFSKEEAIEKGSGGEMHTMHHGHSHTEDDEEHQTPPTYGDKPKHEHAPLHGEEEHQTPPIYGDKPTHESEQKPMHWSDEDNSDCFEKAHEKLTSKCHDHEAKGIAYMKNDATSCKDYYKIEGANDDDDDGVEKPKYSIKHGVHGEDDEDDHHADRDGDDNIIQDDE